MERTGNFLGDESGASALEYGLLIAMIAVVCIYAIKMLGINTSAIFTTVSDVISTAS